MEQREVQGGCSVTGAALMQSTLHSTDVNAVIGYSDDSVSDALTAFCSCGAFDMCGKEPRYGEVISSYHISTVLNKLELS